MGQMYGHDITTDSIYQIDPTTGAATLIGLTGYAANYAQGMDFDNDDGTLYIFLYIGSGSNVYGTVNLTTGAVTPLAVSAPLGEFEGATQTTAVLPDVPWLTEVPTNGVLLPGECVSVAVTFDSDSLPDGVYTADLVIASDDADEPEITIPVTMTVGCADIVVSPPALEVSLCPDATTTLTFTICNDGFVALDWELVEEPETLRASSPFVPAGSAQPGPIPDAPLSVSVPAGGVAQPTPPVNPEAVLWDQPIGANTGAYANQDFEAAFDGYDIFVADNFNNADPWALATIFVPGNTWNTGGDLTCANTLNWQIYADNAGVPAGDPWTGGAYWNLSLAPTDAQVTLSTGVGGYLSDVTLNLAGPLNLPPGTWWLVFYPQLDYSTCFQYGTGTYRSTTNGYAAQVINPGGGFGLPTVWTSVQDATTWALTEQDLAFRLEKAKVVDIPWLSEDPTSGSVPPGECTVVDVTFDSTGLTPGDYLGNLVITSNDPDTPEVTIPVTLTVLQPADITGVTYTVDGMQVAFDATVIGAAPLTYAWTFGDGGTATVEDPTHVYALTGCYTPTLTVTNACGQDTWSERICVCEAVAGADFTWVPTTPWVGEMIDFSGSIDAGSPPLLWHWEFDDGATAGGQSVLHAFATPGDHLVTLTVTNGCGEEVIQHTVTVVREYYYYYLPIISRSYAP